MIVILKTTTLAIKHLVMIRTEYQAIINGNSAVIKVLKNIRVVSDGSFIVKQDDKEYVGASLNRKIFIVTFSPNGVG